MQRVAIIGAGIGEKHLAAFAQLPELFAVETICDLNLARAAAIAQGRAIEITDDLPSVLSDPNIGIIDICLPPHLHFAVCKEALSAGKIVICEKPLVGSLAEADALIAHCQASGMPIYPVFQYRYGIGMAQLAWLIDQGLAGELYAGSVETHWNRDAGYYANPWRGTWAGEQGGAILGHAIHAHDLITAIAGPVTRVFAELTTRVNDIEVEDCAALTFKLASGAVITSSVTLGCATDMSRIRLAFKGFTVESDHEAYAPAAKPWRFIARQPTTQAEIDAALLATPPADPGYVGQFKAIARDLAPGNTSNAPGPVTLADARRSLELITAIYASARTSLPQELPLASDHPLYAGWLSEQVGDAERGNRTQ